MIEFLCVKSTYPPEAFVVTVKSPIEVKGLYETLAEEGVLLVILLSPRRISANVELLLRRFAEELDGRAASLLRTTLKIAKTTEHLEHYGKLTFSSSELDLILEDVDRGSYGC